MCTWDYPSSQIYSEFILGFGGGLEKSLEAQPTGCTGQPLPMQEQYPSVDMLHHLYSTCFICVGRYTLKSKDVQESWFHFSKTSFNYAEVYTQLLCLGEMKFDHRSRWKFINIYCSKIHMNLGIRYSFMSSFQAHQGSSLQTKPKTSVTEEPWLLKLCQDWSRSIRKEAETESLQIESW